MREPRGAWQARPEAGNLFWLKVVLWVARHLGRGVLPLFLWPAAGYFFLRRGAERRASLDFLTRVHGRPAKWHEALMHFYSFARVAADRVYFLAGETDRVPVSFVLDPALPDVLTEGRPGIFLAAHFGSFEAARVVGPSLGGVRLRIVLDKGVNARFMQVLAEVEPEFEQLIIDAGQDSVTLGLAIGDALKAGDWVGFLADRYRQGDRVTKQQFFGDAAPFPQGPYIVASLYKAPVIGIFCRLKDGGYQIHVEVLERAFHAPRSDRQGAVEGLMQRFVNRLETHVRLAPSGWFNFFPFWEDVN
jgi:predicted LPLAT superfamily acyltransferase